MSFLEKSELKTGTTLEIVNLITGSDDTIVSQIIKESIDLMSSYLYEYFDTDAIFATVEDERSLVTLKHLKSIVIYEIFKIRSKQINEVVKNGYDEAMRWLEKIGKDEIKPNLPARQIDTDGDGVPDSDKPFMKLGSSRRYGNHW